MIHAWRGEAEGTDLPIFGAGRGSVAGFDDPALSDAGVDVADALVFHEQDMGDMTAELSVWEHGGLWKMRRKDGSTVVGPKADRKTQATVALRSSNDSNKWLGLALIATDPRDIRPDLLGLVRQRNLVGVERCIRYGANYLLASGHDLDMGLLLAAAADALLILVYGETRGDGTGRKRRDDSYTAGGQVKRHRPRRPTLRARENQFKMGHDGTWAELRDAALKAYRRRLREAAALFAAVDNWRPTPTGRSFSRGFAEPKWLPNSTKVEMTGPMANLFHTRHPTVPPPDWISGRGRLTSSIDIMVSRGESPPCIYPSRSRSG